MSGRLENDSFKLLDTVVSMNGFHAFPDKQKAFHEIWRVLKPGGDFIACFYIRGKSKRTDWLVKNILAKKGWFSPPFQTEKELRDILQKLYKEGMEKFRERYKIELHKADFGNARTVRNILDEAISKHALRLTRDRKAKTNLLTSADINDESRKII